MSTKPSIPKGTRDFSPTEMVRRNYILDTIKTVFQRFGFQQIETPTMENLSTLEGKYGDEGDKLLFRILNSGPVIDEIKNKGSDIKVSDIAEKGLRYDLTVPFARYVAMHQNEITFPFKRYQIQPVWRADRPQKGRYREFVQCDADVVGSDSLLNEVEMVQMIQKVFQKLDINITIRINNRKILSGLAEYVGVKNEDFNMFVIIIDKIDKVGKEKTIKDLESLNLSINKILEFINLLFETPTDISASIINTDRLEKLNIIFKSCDSKIGLKGIEELEYIFSQYMDFHILDNGKLNLSLDISLARGLNYYTGAIFEVKVNDSRSTFTSSILGGGRYDDLTGIFGLPNVSGVGISFGVDRIYDVMEEMKLFDQLNLQSSTTQVMFVNFGKEEEKYCLKLLQKVRTAGINAEIYPESVKMKKQMSYADDKKIPFVVLVGSEEMKTGELTLKNMQTGEQEKISIDNLIKKIA